MGSNFEHCIVGIVLALSLTVVIVLLVNRGTATVSTTRYVPGKTTTKTDTIIHYKPQTSAIPAGGITVTNDTGSAAVAASQAANIKGESVPADSGVFYDTTQRHTYSFAQEYANGAKIQAEISSRFFPAQKPDDVTALLTFTPSPDTVRHTERVDSVFTTTGKKPAISTPAAVSIGFLGGMALTALGIAVLIH